MFEPKGAANKGLHVHSVSVVSATSLVSASRLLSHFIIWNHLRDFVIGLGSLWRAREFIVECLKGQGLFVSHPRELSCGNGSGELPCESVSQQSLGRKSTLLTPTLM